MRKEMVDGYLIELGQPLEPKHRDDSLATLVGPEHRRLDLTTAQLFDLLQGQPALLADQSKSLAPRPAVRREAVLVVSSHAAANRRPAWPLSWPPNGAS